MPYDVEEPQREEERRHKNPEDSPVNPDGDDEEDYDHFRFAGFAW
jgi:hypothetical protein